MGRNFLPPFWNTLQDHPVLCPHLSIPRDNLRLTQIACNNVYWIQLDRNKVPVGGLFSNLEEILRFTINAVNFVVNTLPTQGLIY